MMNFNFHLNTQFHFGKDVLNQLPEEILKYGKNVFFIYDEVPAKVTGAYDFIHSICQDHGIQITDFTGIEPNPRHSTVDQAVKLCKKVNADCIIALGGGSTIDSAKALSFSVFDESSCWDFYKTKKAIKKALPIMTIPTIAASGSEVSNVSVIANYETNEKKNYRSDFIRPVAVFADPTYTYSVPAFQTACGIIDIMCHSYEGYFSHSVGSLQDGISEAIQKTCIEHGKKVMMCPHHYNSRAQLLWASELAIIHLADQGRNFTGIIHTIEGALSGHFHLPHGAGIGIVSLAWFKYSLSDFTVARYARWGRNVWGIVANQDDYTISRLAIAKYEAFLQELGLPTHLSEFNQEITKEQLEDIAAIIFQKGTSTNWFEPIETKEQMLELLYLLY